MTLTEQINAINYEGLTEENFNFLKERALKSIRKGGNAKRGLTKTQKENLGFKEQIVAMLIEEGGMTATQIGKAFGWNGSQKATALLNQLEKAGMVVKKKEGKVTLFFAEEAESEEEEAE